MRVGLPYATRVGRRAQLRHGVGSEFGDRLLCRHREGDTQGQAQLDCLPYQFLEVRALGVAAGGARGDEQTPPIERMRGIVNGYDFWGVSE